MERILLAHWTKNKLDRYTYRLDLHYKRVIKLESKADIINVLELAARWMYFNNKCCFCGDGRRTVQIDHLVAVSKKGEHVLLNLFPCCKRCNRFKSTKNWKDWYSLQEYYSEEKELKIITAIETKDPGNYLPLLEKRTIKR